MAIWKTRLATTAMRVVCPELVLRMPNGRPYDYTKPEFSHMLQSVIRLGEPHLVARLGSVEALSCLHYIKQSNALIAKNWNYLPEYIPVAPIAAESHPGSILDSRKKQLASTCPRSSLRERLWVAAGGDRSLSPNAGVFPETPSAIADFCETYLAAMRDIDTLGSWMRQESYLTPFLGNAKTVDLEDLVPFVSDDPWTAALAGKRVLVVHPFKRSIETQYAKRELLFANPIVLPDFDLITYEAVQSIGGSHPEYSSWHEALEAMKHDIGALDFDVAILGCGAYGLPLGSHIKSMGKVAIHLGGVTQCLFGIKGRRWVEDYSGWSDLYINEHWVWPREDERPDAASSVEGACYWGPEV